MSTIEPVAEDSALSRFAAGIARHRRWALLATIFVAELIVFSIHFDTAALARVKDEWAVLLGQVGLLGKLAVSVVAAALIFSDAALRNRFRLAAERADETRLAWGWLLAHFLLIAIFYQLCTVLFGGRIQDSSRPLMWIALWFAAGAASLLCLAASALPLKEWSNVGFSFPWVAVLVTVVGMIALAVGQLSDSLWRPLGSSTLAIAAQLLRVFYADVSIDPNELVISAKSFSIQIAPGCSGYEGLGLVLVFVSCFLWRFRRELRFPRALLLLPAGLLAIWLANGVRIAALVAIGASVSESVALGGFHSQAGWLAFNLVALAVMATGLNSSFFARLATGPREIADSEYAAAPFLVPFLALLGIAMITSAIATSKFEVLYSLRVLAVLGAVAFYWNFYQRNGLFGWNWAWQPVAIGVAVFALWTALEPPHDSGESASYSPAVGLVGSSAVAVILWTAFRAIGSIVAVPIAEELAFRGYLTRRLVSEDFDSLPMGQFSWFSFVISSALFGLMHGRWLAGTLAGLLFALSLYHRGRLMDAIVAHATANGLITGYVLATGNWAAWS